MAISSRQLEASNIQNKEGYLNENNESRSKRNVRKAC